ncbi:MAG: hypothetical protein CL954_08265 [Erythrobacteraceae bacterium]|nr:hypothetical protein [Erythrobacteraceae bacterium]
MSTGCRTQCSRTGRNSPPPRKWPARPVALKHEITYRRPAFLDDDVIAETVLEKIAGARSFYNTVIRRGEDVLAEVQSMWCCIDAKSLRPARISREVAETCFGLPGKPKVQTGS